MFNTGLMLQTAVHDDSCWKTGIQSNLWHQSNVELIPLYCTVMDQTVTTFESKYKSEFLIKRFQNNTIYLGHFWRVNKVEKFVEVRGTLTF